MARSTYVYVVEANSRSGFPRTIGAFTVKHELVTWWKKQSSDRTPLMVAVRMLDGQPDDRVVLDMSEFN